MWYDSLREELLVLNDRGDFSLFCVFLLEWPFTQKKTNRSYTHCSILQLLFYHHHLFPHPPASSLPCNLLQLSNLGLYNRPHHDSCLGLLSHLHPLFFSDNRWAHGGLGGGGGRISIAVANSECMLDLCFCVKGHSNKNIQKSENRPGRWEPITPLSENHITSARRPHLPWQFDFKSI